MALLLRPCWQRLLRYLVTALASYRPAESDASCHGSVLGTIFAQIRATTAQAIACLYCAGPKPIPRRNPNPVTPKVTGDGVPLIAPLLIMGSSAMKDFLKPETKLSMTLARWRKEFPSTKICKSSGCVHAPLPMHLGGTEVMSCLDTLFPPSSRVKSAMQKFKDATQTVSLYGHNDLMLASDFEPDLLGSVRFQLGGETHLVLISAPDAMKLMKELRLKVVEPSLRSFLTSLNRDVVAKAESMKLTILRCKVTPGQVLYVPLGWIACQTTVGESNVHGVRVSIMCATSASLADAKQTATALASMAEASYAKWASSLADLAVFEADKLVT